MPSDPDSPGRIVATSEAAFGRSDQRRQAAPRPLTIFLVTTSEAAFGRSDGSPHRARLTCVDGDRRERPAMVIRAGLQVDHWEPFAQRTSLRASLGEPVGTAVLAGRCVRCQHRQPSPRG